MIFCETKVWGIILNFICPWFYIWSIQLFPSFMFIFWIITTYHPCFLLAALDLDSCLVTKLRYQGIIDLTVYGVMNGKQATDLVTKPPRAKSSILCVNNHKILTADVITMVKPRKSECHVYTLPTVNAMHLLQSCVTFLSICNQIQINYLTALRWF